MLSAEVNSKSFFFVCFCWAVRVHCFGHVDESAIPLVVVGFVPNIRVFLQASNHIAQRGKERFRLQLDSVFIEQLAHQHVGLGVIVSRHGWEQMVFNLIVQMTREPIIKHRTLHVAGR